MHAHLHTTCAHGVEPDCTRTICTHLLQHRQVSQPKNVNGENERKLKSMRRPTYAQNTHTHTHRGHGSTSIECGFTRSAPCPVRTHVGSTRAPSAGA